MLRRFGPSSPLVLFVHTHKCAGTAVIDLFRREGFTLVPGTEKLGAMPEYLSRLKDVTDPGELDAKYGRREVRRFLRETRSSGVNFVATEWVVPPALSAATRRRGVFAFTVLRDPLTRYVSNYAFDVRSGYSSARDLWGFRDGLMYREHDYYTRLFSGKLVRDTRKTSDDDLDRALDVLERLDAICIQERPETLVQLRAVGVDEKKLRRRNVTRSEEIQVPDDFRSEFIKHAWRDYILYERGLRIAVDAVASARHLT